MVLQNELYCREGDDTCLLALYSEIYINKNEYRFSYWMLQNQTGQFVSPMQEENEGRNYAGRIRNDISKEDVEDVTKISNLSPHFYKLFNIRIEDLIKV